MCVFLCVFFCVCFFVFFFFFQAEDGIGDIGVTGVQTCALPILTVKNLKSLPCFQKGGEKHTIPVIGTRTHLVPVVHNGRLMEPSTPLLGFPVYAM